MSKFYLDAMNKERKPPGTASAERSDGGVFNLSESSVPFKEHFTLCRFITNDY